MDYAGWRGVMWNLLSDVVDESVKSAFLARPPEYVVSDDLSWLDEIVLAEHQIETNIKTLLAERLAKRFKAFRAAHGARPMDVTSYYRGGLLPLVPQTIHDLANEIFLGGAFPELSQENMDEAIRSVGADLREGRVWFGGNEKMLVEHCGHYMLYGSEYLIAIAAHLDGPRDYRQVLKSSANQRCSFATCRSHSSAVTSSRR